MESFPDEAIELAHEWLSNDRVQIQVCFDKRLIYVDVVTPALRRSRDSFIAGLKEKNIVVSGIEDFLLELVLEQAKRSDSRRLVFERIEPCAEWVDGKQLLDDLAELFTRHIVLPDHAAVALALWVVHTHCMKAVQHTPRLLITSPEKRCGKSLTMAVLEALCFRGLPTEGITAAALFRTIALASPTMLGDEADCWLVGRSGSGELRAVLNSGYRRGGCIIRCDGTFKTFAAMAIAMIGWPGNAGGSKHHLEPPTEEARRVRRARRAAAAQGGPASVSPAVCALGG